MQYFLTLNGEKIHKKAHRLVAELFIENKESLPVINHKDGNKLNNHVSNLEWCTYEHNNHHAIQTGLRDVVKSNKERWKDAEFRERTSKNISEALIKSGACAGKKNGRFRYLINIDDEEVSRKELAKRLGISQSYCDTIIRKYCQGENIDILERNNVTIIDTKK